MNEDFKIKILDKLDQIINTLTDFTNSQPENIRRALLDLDQLRRRIMEYNLAIKEF